MNAFVERHQASISSTLSCFDRVVITGTLPDICHPWAMAGFLDYHNVRLFDFPRWAEPLREEVRENAEQIAEAAGLQIDFIRKLKAFRKDALRCAQHILQILRSISGTAQSQAAKVGEWHAAPTGAYSHRGTLTRHG